MERGIVCGLTNEKPTFDKHCADLQAPANDIAELEESMIGGSQKSIIKILTAIVIVVFAIAMGVMWMIHNNENKIKNQKAAEKTAKEMRFNEIQAMVDAKMAMLPQTSNGIVYDSISLHKKYVGYTLRLPNTYIQNYPDDRLICESKFRHSEALKNLRDEDQKLLKACINDSLQIRYAFREATDFPIYTIVVHPKDMELALNAKEPFRCPQKDFDRVLRSETKVLPYDFVSRIQLSAIKMDYGTNKLTLNLRSRRKDNIKGAGFEKLVKTELWASAYDQYSVKMLMLNDGEVDFRFIDTNDRLIESVVIGPNFYRNANK
jgi:hypothetical protein